MATANPQKFFIICHSHRQGTFWLSDKYATDPTFYEKYPNKNDVIIVSHPDHVRGMRVTTGIFLEQWSYGNKDPLALLMALYCASNDNQVIRKMINDYSAPVPV